VWVGKSEVLKLKQPKDYSAKLPATYKQFSKLPTIEVLKVECILVQRILQRCMMQNPLQSKQLTQRKLPINIE
jgi:hypothetical protein